MFAAGEGADMGINKESDISASLQIGPTSLGMVRLYVETETMELPLDFDPAEAEEIAEELCAAAARAREIGAGSGGQKKKSRPSHRDGSKRRKGSSN